ncbi:MULTISPECIES: tonB-system energizer ExbB [unclassified Bosea (in: a-proteobacteria)]|uniref:tonB-system energizer ExbB n=1 Tax=unclassified Bosea (in: a-proteobacteria) TaxID=2653178 RepID=UPI000954A47B|nr:MULTISPECIES: tonB-system energizer ExbB [unclassified Bosea (in: a-proteobacteria)]SIQ44611.1 outer membrane transport energization protein ExbB [Bosea sp. TND4EK4]
MSVLRSAIVAIGLVILPLSAGQAQTQLQTAPPAGAAAPSNPVPQALPGMGIAPPSTAHPAFSAEAPAPAAPPAAAATAVLPHDLSPWGMFMAADIVVKAVMIGLAFASLVTWTIWLAKAMELAAAKTAATRALRRLEQADSLQAAAQAMQARRGRLSGAVGNLVSSALDEARRSADLGTDGTKERAAIALSRVEARAGRNMARGTGLLATIGSTAPFVGLFGTVWGIMNSFIGISQAKTTNLAVVAPGIAEALLATAIGLVAAIPAVIIYNVFARAITGYRATLSDASGEILRHLSRDLERRQRGGAVPPRIAAE